MSTFRAWFERNLSLQSTDYAKVVLIDENNLDSTLQHDGDVCRLALKCAEREYADSGQPLVIAICRPAFSSVNLNATAAPSAVRTSCDVPEFYQQHFLRVVACSSYIMPAKGRGMNAHAARYSATTWRRCGITTTSRPHREKGSMARS